jgi:hypothetical protein
MMKVKPKALVALLLLVIAGGCVADVGEWRLDVLERVVGSACECIAPSPATRVTHHSLYECVGVNEAGVAAAAAVYNQNSTTAATTAAAEEPWSAYVLPAAAGMQSDECEVIACSH